MRKLLKYLLNLIKIRSRRILPAGGILITVPGASFDLFLSYANSYYGFVDLSDLLHGDEIEIFEYLKPWNSRDFILHRSQKFNGPVGVPLVSFPLRTIDCPVKIVLKQNTGMRRNVWYSFKYD